MGLLNAGCSRIATEFAAWMNGILAPTDRRWGWQTVTGGVDETLSRLLPLRNGPLDRMVLMPCKGGWTAIYDNSALGTDPSKISVLAERMNVTGIGAVDRPQSIKRGSPDGDYGAVILEVYAGESGMRRVLYTMNDGGKWEFYQSGEPFGFEHTECYLDRSIKRRFTSEMLASYLDRLAVDPFVDPSLVEGDPSILLTERPACASQTQRFGG